MTTPALNDDLVRLLRQQSKTGPVNVARAAMADAAAALQAQANEIEALRSAHGILNEAVEIIAGERHCADNLMGNAEVAIDALRRIRALTGALNHG